MPELISFAPGHPLTKDFANFGRNHRQQFSYIVPPFKNEELEQLNPAVNPFFEYGKMRCWITGNSKKVHGRVAAMINPRIPFSQGQLGLIGFFDVVENKPTAFALFDAAVEWLQKQGCTHCWAPVNFSIWHYYRFAVDHFEETPFVGEPKNPPWYPEFAEDYGFQQQQHWDSWWVEQEGMDHLIEKFEHQYQLFLKVGYSHTLFDKKKADHFLRIVHELVMKGYRGFPGFHPVTFAEFQKLYAPIAKVIDENGSLFIESPDRSNSGFLLGFRDLGRALTAMNGRKDPLSVMKYLWHSQAKQYFNVGQGLLLPEAKESAYQQSLKQLGERMSPSLATVQHGLALARKAGYKGFLFSLMLPEAPNRAFIENHISRQHRHILYQIKI